MNEIKECILVGGGVSIREGISLGLLDKIKDKDVWSLNFAYKTLPFLPKRELWLDLSFFKNNIEDLQKLYNQGVKCYTKVNNKYKGIPEIITFNTSRSIDEIGKMFVGRMGLTGFFAISLAIKENYDICYLLGFDFGRIEGETDTHYYQRQINVISTGVGKPTLYLNNNFIKDEVKDFELFLKSNMKIFNVSPKSNIPYFQKISYTKFFELINKKENNV